MFPVQSGVSCMWTNDSKRILMEHFDAIQNSPSYLYHYALPFCPSSSWLYECYIVELSQEVRVVEGLQDEWGMCSRILPLNCKPSTLSYQNNSIAVGSEYEDILILDAITGSQTAIFNGHKGEVTSVAFSSDGALLVSGSSDRTIRLWDIQTGGIVKTLHGRTSWIYSVSISADNTTIASVSQGREFYLWNIQTGACYKTIQQESHIYHVTFSPKDPQILMSVSTQTVQQWNIDGHKVGPACHDFCLFPSSFTAKSQTPARASVTWTFTLPFPFFSSNIPRTYLILSYLILSPFYHHSKTKAKHVSFESSMEAVYKSQETPLKNFLLQASSISG